MCFETEKMSNSRLRSNQRQTTVLELYEYVLAGRKVRLHQCCISAALHGIALPICGRAGGEPSSYYLLPILPLICDKRVDLVVLGLTKVRGLLDLGEGCSSQGFSPSSSG